MIPPIRILGAAFALALAAGLAAAQDQNDLTANNGADVLYLYSSPSIGFSAQAFPPDVSGDLYWRAAGPGVLDDVDDAYLGISGTSAIMEIDGYVEAIYDTDWSTVPDIYARTHSLAVTNAMGGLEPDFLSLGTITGVTVLIGTSGFGSPCTIAPSLCGPGGCAPPGFVTGFGYTLSLTNGTVGAGILIGADGTAGSTLATTWFVPGGMTALGGPCGLGDYSINDAHSTDETAADVTGNGINPDGGFQIGGGAFTGNEPFASMSAQHETWHGNVVQVRADTGTGQGVESQGGVGGALNGRYLSVGSGAASLGVSLIDRAGLQGSSIALAGASLTALANPGLPLLGGHLLVFPSGLLAATAAAWQALGPIEAFASVQLSIPVAAAGATLVIQGAVVNPFTGTADTTNATRCLLRL